MSEWTLKQVDNVIDKCSAEIYSLTLEIKNLNNKIEVDREVREELQKDLKRFQNIRKELLKNDDTETDN